MFNKKQDFSSRIFTYTLLYKTQFLLLFASSLAFYRKALFRKALFLYDLK